MSQFLVPRPVRRGWEWFVQLYEREDVERKRSSSLSASQHSVSECAIFQETAIFSEHMDDRRTAPRFARRGPSEIHCSGTCSG